MKVARALSGKAKHIVGRTMSGESKTDLLLSIPDHLLFFYPCASRNRGKLMGQILNIEIPKRFNFN